MNMQTLNLLAFGGHFGGRGGGFLAFALFLIITLALVAVLAQKEGK
jgi:hypothetical protein